MSDAAAWFAAVASQCPMCHRPWEALGTTSRGEHSVCQRTMAGGRWALAHVGESPACYHEVIGYNGADQAQVRLRLGSHDRPALKTYLQQLVAAFGCPFTALIREHDVEPPDAPRD